MANHDLVLRGGRVIDGTGAAAAGADVAIDGDRITAVDHVPRGSGRREIDAAGLVAAVCPTDGHPMCTPPAPRKRCKVARREFILPFERRSSLIFRDEEFGRLKDISRMRRTS